MEQGPESEFVSIYDAHGRPLRISRRDWLLNSQANMRRAWNDATKLYDLCLAAAHRKDYEILDEPTVRLLEIEPGADDVLALRASVLASTNRMAEVEPLVREAIAKYGPSAPAYFHLGRALNQQGKHKDYLELLQKALALDPNHLASLQSWTYEYRQQHSDRATLKMLQAMAKKRKSWMAAHFAGAQFLREGDVRSAVASFEQVLSMDGWSAEALLQITRELMAKDLHRETLDVVKPHYLVGTHPTEVGLALVKSLIVLKDAERAEALLHEIAIKAGPVARDEIGRLGSQITALDSTPRTVQVDRPITPVALALSRPTWWDALRRPEWLLPTVDRPRRIGLFALSVAQGPDSTRDRIGRLSRSIPSYLAERLLFESDWATETVRFMAPDLGPLVFPEIEESAFRGAVSKGVERILMGYLNPNGLSWRITLQARQVPSLDLMSSFEAEFVIGEEGPALAAFADRVLAELGGSGTAAATWYRAPEPAITSEYLKCLEQQSSLYHVEQGFGSKESIRGRREILHWLHRLALEMPNSQGPLIFFSALASDKSQGYDYRSEMKSFALDLLRGAQAGDVLDRISPLVYDVLDMPLERDRVMERLEVDASSAYRSWLAELRH
jgi:hypothetical protein